MDISYSSTPISLNRRTVSSTDYTKQLSTSLECSPSIINNLKLKLTFEKHFIKSQIQKITNRINKVVALEKEKAIKNMQGKQSLEDSLKKRERNLNKHKEKESIKEKRFQSTLEIKEKIQQERKRRFSHIKELENDTLQERKKIAKKLKAEENE